MTGDLEFLSPSIGMILADTDGCRWRTGVETSGTLVASLINCPASGFVLMEDSSYVLQEDSSKIVVE